jgi:hypothetical protein
LEAFFIEFLLQTYHSAARVYYQIPQPNILVEKRLSLPESGRLKGMSRIHVVKIANPEVK